MIETTPIGDTGYVAMSPLDGSRAVTVLDVDKVDPRALDAVMDAVLAGNTISVAPVQQPVTDRWRVVTTVVTDLVALTGGVVAVVLLTSIPEGSSEAASPLTDLVATVTSLMLNMLGPLLLGFVLFAAVRLSWLGRRGDFDQLRVVETSADSRHILATETIRPGDNDVNRLLARVTGLWPRVAEVGTDLPAADLARVRRLAYNAQAAVALLHAAGRDQSSDPLVEQLHLAGEAVARFTVEARRTIEAGQAVRARRAAQEAFDAEQAARKQIAATAAAGIVMVPAEPDGAMSDMVAAEPYGVIADYPGNDPGSWQTYPAAGR